ncbi:MAG: acetoacetate decarboxylase family protein [Planctomycetes bacterium]|nr:acetoacetate decarboxylase family protein [Planctomycetota bacterium]
MSGFFDGVEQEPISFHGHRAKAPLFFRDLHLMAGVFTADLAAARSLMPTPRHHPLSLVPRRAVAAVHCMEYRETDIGPYNEVSLSVAIAWGRPPRLGSASLSRAVLTGKYHAQILSLPVNTEPALWGGVEVFNYPKYLAGISFEETASSRICTVRERETGALILRAEGERIRTRAHQDRGRPKTMEMLSYPVKDGAPLRARMLVHLRESARSFFRSRMRLEFGPHPRAELFRRLGIGKALQYLFAPRGEAILYRPEVCASSGA